MHNSPTVAFAAAGRRVLLVGEIGRQIRDELAERGVLLTLVATLSDGFAALENDFDVVVVNPLTDACGVDFVSALKEGPDDHEHTLATLLGARGAADRDDSHG